MQALLGAVSLSVIATSPAPAAAQPAPADVSSQLTVQPSGPPLSLAEAIVTALRNNPQAVSALSNQEAARARIKMALSAWLPQLTTSTQARGDYSYQTGVSERESIGTVRYNVQLGISQLIYDFGRTGGRVDVAKAGLRIATADADAAVAQVALGVATGFYSVLQAEALMQVALRNLEQQRQRLLQAESFYRIGTRPEIDVLIAKTAVAQADLQLVQARNNILTARAQLVQAIGNPELTWLPRPLDDTLPPPLPAESQPIEAMVDQALRGRPDYESSRERVAQAEASLRATRGDFYPTLSVGVTGSMSGSVGGLALGSVGGTARPDVPTAGQPGFAVSGFATLAWSPFSGLQTFYAVREAEALVRVARANLELLRQQVRSTVQQGVIAVGTARESVAAAQAVLVQAEKQLQMASGRYRAGVGNAIELGDAQLQVTTARGQRVQADYALASARARLSWQLGQAAPRQSVAPGAQARDTRRVEESPR